MARKRVGMLKAVYWSAKASATRRARKQSKPVLHRVDAHCRNHKALFNPLSSADRDARIAVERLGAAIRMANGDDRVVLDANAAKVLLARIVSGVAKEETESVREDAD